MKNDVTITVRVADAVAHPIGTSVWFVGLPDTKGTVTAVVFRGSGVQYAVTWHHDLTERWHAAPELTQERPGK